MAFSGNPTQTLLESLNLKKQKEYLALTFNFLRFPIHKVGEDSTFAAWGSCNIGGEGAHATGRAPP